MMKTKLIVTVITFSLIFFSFQIKAQEDTDPQKKTSPLFAAKDPLKFSLTIDIKKLKKDNSENPEYSDGNLILHENTGDISFDIKVKARGHSRRMFDICSFPPIKLNFKKKAVKGTVFEGQDKIKLVAYCKDADITEMYVLKEYLVYKLYNHLTPNSFQVRLANITYKDINEKGKDVHRYGFLIEDDDLLAERIGGKISEISMSNQDRCERNSLDQLTLFQYMIGNTDWSIAKRHNVEIVVMENGAIIPIPFDFDYSGLVDAQYAVPQEDLPIENVKERLFRGYCRLPGTYEKVLENFNANKENIYKEFNDLEPLDPRHKKAITKYLDEFYKIINDPKQVKRRIYDSCQINHTHLHSSKK